MGLWEGGPASQPHPHAWYLLFLQLPNGALCLLKVLCSRATLLSHHCQLPFDDIVLLSLLCPCHLPLSTVRMGVGRVP